MKQSSLIAISVASAFLSGCSSSSKHAPRIMTTVQQNKTETVLSIVCERPAGTPLVYTLPLPELQQQAVDYARVVSKAVRKKEVLPTDYIPQTYRISNGWDTLALSYKPYQNEMTGHLQLIGTVTCGHLEGVSTENRFSYATGAIEHPFDIFSLENMMRPKGWQGTGGYKVTITVQRPLVQTMR